MKKSFTRLVAYTCMLSVFPSNAWFGETNTADARGGGGGGRGGFSGGGGGGMSRPSGGFGGGGGGFSGGGNFGGGGGNFGGGNFGGGGGGGGFSRSDFGGGGGGGFNGGGFNGGGAAANRSPSLGRSQFPSYSPDGGGRSQFGNGNFGSGNFGNGNFGSGNFGNGGFGGDGAFGRGGAGQAGAASRPTRQSLDSFLDMPGSGGGQSARSNSFNQNNDRTTTTTPGGATVIRGDNGAVIKGDNGAAVIGGGSYTTKGGTTIGGAGAAGYYNGPNGATHVGGGGAAGITNGTESAGVAGRFSGTAGPNGGRSGSASGIAAATNGNGVTRVAGGTAAGARGPGGAAIGGAAGFNGQMQNGRFTGTAGSGSAIRGPAGNTWTNRNQAAVVNGQIVAGQHWNTVNGNFTHWNYFGAGWRGYYPNAWWPGQWAVAATAWTAATWAVAGSYVGVTGDPNYYDYNNGVSYQDGTVYYGDQPVAAADQYYREALDLALRGEQSTGDDWLPLGVFGFVSQGQQEADKLVQLAINKQGILRGNYQDTVSNQVTPVFGAVDKQTQKAAFMMTGNDSLVVETGLYNLTNDEVPVLVHYDAENQANRTLMRLKQPTQDGAAGTPAPQQQSSQQVSPQQPGPAVID